MKKGPRTVWIGIGITMVLIVVGLLLASYRQQKELELLRAELEAKGERLDFRDLIPTVPKGKSNGAMDLEPVLNLIGWIRSGIVTRGFDRPGVAIPMSRTGSFPAEFRDYSGSRTTNYWVSNQWEHAEQLVELHRADWELVSRAATNDVIVRHLDWMKGPRMGSRNLSGYQSLTRWSRIAVISELRGGNFDSAIRLLTEVLRVIGIQREPLIGADAIRMSAIYTCGRAVWEILQYDEWNEVQLMALQNAIDEIHYAAPGLESALMCRAHMVAEWERWMESPGKATIFRGWPISSRKWWDTAMVRAWSLGPAFAELSWYLADEQKHLEAARAGVRAKSVDVFTRHTNAILYSPPSRFFLRTAQQPKAVFRIGKTMAAEAQRSVLLAAVALKRFSLAHGHHPDSLGELIPRYLSEVPVDWMDGQPIRYRRVAQDDFVLWSIGNDGDEGGDAIPPKPRKHYYWTYGRDWVWPSCATEEEIRKFEEEQLIKWRKAK